MQWITATALVLLPLSVKSDHTKEQWDKNCASCHGKDGKGDTKMGRKSGVKDYTDAKVQAEMTDAKALKAIKNGIVENGKERMKGYSEKLSEADIKALVAYMRTFAAHSASDKK